MSRLLRLVLAGALVAAPVALSAGAVDPDLLAGMQARSIGPAGMSGRVAAIDAVAADPNVIYVGAATGGVWKSINGGLTWTPIFDDQPVAAVGAVAVFQAAPDVVWVGTGEGNPRNSVSVGNGVYKSLDGGASWQHVGLERTERIHRIVLHPTDPQVAWVAALGRSWGENAERGVFKTTDGGRSWNKVLYVDESTGAADLVLDPANPDKLFAAMWDYRRWPWFFRSGGPGSGLWVSHDGGESWTRRTPEDGLPEGELGRIGVAVSRSDPRVVYALIEAEENALYRSDDGGKSWSRTAATRNVGNRPFYYADIRVDPERSDTVYSLWSLVSVSRDGGKSFEVLVPFQQVHPDHHALWIDPADGRRLILGNDGGVAFSQDRGESWRFASNLPLAQFYHVQVDLETPYNVYGGLQDNGSWRGPSGVWENGGIRNHHWEEVCFGDGFDTLPLPGDSMIGYAMSQEGFLRRWNLRSGERKDIRPPGPEGVDLRFNWNAGIAVDPFDSDALYYGSQFVHYSTDRGDSWTIVSGDLTSNNPEWQKQARSGGLTPDVTGAENFTSIVTIAPSPVERGVVWVGTDDGRIQVTRDGGESWSSVEDGLKGVPAHTWVPHIEASPHDAATAFAVLDNHRRSDWTPYVFRTTDYGRSWTSLAGDELRGYCLVLEQDPVDPRLLFLGTEFGLWFSVDGGAAWARFEHGFPTVGTRDLVVHPRESDLVIGTHGRAAYVLDDIRPFRELAAGALDEPLHLYGLPDAQQYRVKQTGASRFPGDGEFRGENRPYGALISYSLNLPGLPHPVEARERERKQREREAGEKGGEAAEDEKQEEPEVRIEIADASGEVIRELDQPARLGLNRVAWDLRMEAFDAPPSDDADRRSPPQGPEALPGQYTVRVSYGEHTAEGRLQVLADPRFSVPLADRQAKLEMIQRAGRLQEVAAEALRRLLETRSDVAVLRTKAEQANAAAEKQAGGDAEPPCAAVLESAGRLDRALDEMEDRLWARPDGKGIRAEKDALSKIRYALRNLGSSWDAPTEAQAAYLREARDALRAALTDYNRLYAEEVTAFRTEVQAAGLELLPIGDALQAD